MIAVDNAMRGNAQHSPFQGEGLLHPDDVSPFVLSLNCSSALVLRPGKSCFCVGREAQVCKRPLQFKPVSPCVWSSHYGDLCPWCLAGVFIASRRPRGISQSLRQEVVFLHEAASLRSPGDCHWEMGRREAGQTLPAYLSPVSQKALGHPGRAHHHTELSASTLARYHLALLGRGSS